MRPASAARDRGDASHGAAVLLVIASATAGCDGAGGDATSSSSTRERPALCDEPDEPPQPGAGVPEGWTSWACFEPHSPCTALWLPPDPSDLAPITWESCSDDELENMPCERMQDGDGVAFYTTDDQGRPLLGIERDDGNSREFVLVEANGPVRLAALQTDVDAGAPECLLALKAASSDRLALEFDSGAGLVLLETPGARLVQRDASYEATRLSDRFLLRAGGEFVDRFEVDVDLALHDSVSWRDARFGDSAIVGDDLFFGSGNFTDEGGFAIQSFTEGAGVRVLDAFPDDPEQGAFDVGADASWIVWMRGATPVRDSGLFGSVWSVAAPFTTDPAALEPRMMRSWGRQFPGSPWVVGCGHAARQDVGKLQVMRLADGQTWNISGPYSAFSYSITAMGVSCEHIYLRSVGYPGGVLRVALEDLGEGQPP
jgi:hypothetical protein